MVDDVKIVNVVSKEIAGICRLYGVDFYQLDKKRIEMLVAIFQLGVGFMQSDLAQGVLSHDKTKDDKDTN